MRAASPRVQVLAYARRTDQTQFSRLWIRSLTSFISEIKNVSKLRKGICREDAKYGGKKSPHQSYITTHVDQAHICTLRRAKNDAYEVSNHHNGCLCASGQQRSKSCRWKYVHKVPYTRHGYIKVLYGTFCGIYVYNVNEVASRVQCAFTVSWTSAYTHTLAFVWA